MADLIERTRLAAKILRDIGGQSAMAATVEEAAAALEAAREDACVALVADIRFACGDNGKRMQPELVEFIRELAVDAERYRWLCDGNGYFMEEAGLCHINNEKPEADAAIDKAMRGEW